MASKPPLPGGSRLRQIGWAVVLGCCLVLFLALTFQVNAVKSEVRLIERKIIALQRQKLMLETEFQTRASQRQLAEWNAVEFGYVAPRADQYLESERQLARLGTPRGIGTPDPIRVARAEPAVEQPGLLAGWMTASSESGAEGSSEDAASESSPPEPDQRFEMDAGTLAQRLARGRPIAGLQAESVQ